MPANYTIVPVFQVRATKTYSTIQEDSKPKIFTSEAEAQKFINHLEEAFSKGVDSVTPKKPE